MRQDCLWVRSGIWPVNAQIPGILEPWELEFGNIEQDSGRKKGLSGYGITLDLWKNSFYLSYTPFILAQDAQSAHPLSVEIDAHVRENLVELACLAQLGDLELHLRDLLLTRHVDDEDRRPGLKRCMVSDCQLVGAHDALEAFHVLRTSLGVAGECVGEF